MKAYTGWVIPLRGPVRGKVPLPTSRPKGVLGKYCPTPVGECARMHWNTVCVPLSHHWGGKTSQSTPSLTPASRPCSSSCDDRPSRRIISNCAGYQVTNSRQPAQHSTARQHKLHLHLLHLRLSKSVRRRGACDWQLSHPFPLSAIPSHRRRAHDDKTRPLLTIPQGPAPFSFLPVQSSHPPTAPSAIYE